MLKYDYLNPRGVGAPTKYHPDVCDEMHAYFNVKPYTIKEHISFNKFGQATKTYTEVPNETPHFEKFAAQIGVHRDTLNEWARTHKEFNVVYRQCRVLQKIFLSENAMRGNFNATAYIFTAKNFTDMRDKVEVESRNKNTNVRLTQKEAREIAKRVKGNLKADLNSDES